MSRMRYFCLLFTACIGFSACVTSSLPNLVIPEGPNELNAGFALASSGLDVNTSYAFSPRFLTTGAFHYGFSKGPVLYGEVGLGVVSKNRKNMFVGSFGHGKFHIIPFLTLGGGNEISDYYGHFFKIALSLNNRINTRFGLSHRISVYSGTDNGTCQWNCNRFFNRHFSEPVSYELTPYLRLGKRRELILSLGGILAIRSGMQDGDKDVFLRPPVVYTSIGYNFSIRGNQKQAPGREN